MKCLRVHGEISHGGTVFRSHVGNGGAVGEGKSGGAGSIEFNKLSDHLVLAEDLRDSESQVCRCGSRGKFPRKVKTDDFWSEEG